MTPFDHMLGNPVDDLDRRFAEALARAPESEREIKGKIWEVARDCERTMNVIRADLRDCNIILARTIGRVEHFLATGEPIRDFGTPRHAR